jgi:hypothetical protein
VDQIVRELLCDERADVLLLRPAGPQAGFRFDPRLRPPPDAPERPGGVVVATIHHLAVPASPDVVASLLDEIEPATLLAQLITESARNTFARLPVREDANVFVAFAAYPSADACPPSIASSVIVSRQEHLLLEPTRRSFLRHRPTPPPLPSGERAG